MIPCPSSTSARRRRAQASSLSVGCLLVFGFVLYSTAASINPPIGQHTNPPPAELAQGKNFGSGDPVVLTSYFYWYDVFSGAHIQNPDGSDALTDHPPTLTGFSYRSSSWHKTQLRDMVAAGIDVLLPVYWGEPSQRRPGRPIAEQPWSFSGVPPLIAARQELLDAGEAPPAIGLFYDTSTLEYNQAGRRIDLTTDEGRRWFYETIRDFFSLVPARHWAMIEGKPLIFLYSAGFAAAHDQTCIDYAKQEFARDFSGRVPYIVREISWNVRADNTYAWGGAISLRNPGVAALGPGYDHSAVPGRTPLIVRREEGAFFERNWIRFLRAPSRLLHVETWNEFHEGTDIAESREYGRHYIALNRKYADMFKAGIKPARPRGAYTDVKSVTTTLEGTNQAKGLTQFESADGATVATSAAGSACRAVAPTIHQGRYVYFQIDESFKWADRMLVDVDVEYLDQSGGTFRIEYDGPDTNAPFNGAYTSTKSSVGLGGTGLWKTARFRLIDSRFLNSQNGGADFRIVVESPTLLLRRVTVTRLGMPPEAGALINGWQQDFSEPMGTNWLARSQPGAFQQIGGSLRAGPATESSMLLAAATASAVNRELLARVRVLSSSPSPNWVGGLLVGSGDHESESCAVLFRRDAALDTQLGVILSGDSFGPFLPHAWKTNQWYWLRIKHAPQESHGYADVYARLWPADGESPEPPGWTTWRDYFPSTGLIGGEPGIMAGQGVFEVDYLLVRFDEAPSIRAQPPPHKPRLPILHAVALDQALRIVVQGDPGIGYFLESSTNLAHWTSLALTADGSGTATFTDTNVLDVARLYRARMVP